MRVLIGVFAVAGCTTAVPPIGAWDTADPDRNAPSIVKLFSEVCVANLGRSSRMQRSVDAARVGLRTDFAGDEHWGPVWSSQYLSIVAYDHGHNHAGDECRIAVQAPAAPSAGAMIDALRLRGIVEKAGEPAEFGATVFKRGDSQIFVRRDVPEEATGLTESDAGLTLLIRRPAG